MYSAFYLHHQTAYLAGVTLEWGNVDIIEVIKTMTSGSMTKEVVHGIFEDPCQWFSGRGQVKVAGLWAEFW
jgi:hypothetical protein